MKRDTTKPAGDVADAISIGATTPVRLVETTRVTPLSNSNRSRDGTILVVRIQAPPKFTGPAPDQSRFVRCESIRPSADTFRVNSGGVGDLRVFQPGLVCESVELQLTRLDHRSLVGMGAEPSHNLGFDGLPQ